MVCCRLFWRVGEQNVFRPDHYPWKVGTQIQFYKESYSEIIGIYSEWQEETQRKENNEGKIIIPEVKIYGKTFSKEFTDIEVTAHNLRDDVFQEGVITAIDAILSLADQGEITYELNWYDSIGQASVVRSLLGRHNRQRHCRRLLRFCLRVRLH